MQDDTHYFLQHVPQSEYRITKATGKRKPVFIDLDLHPLALTNDDVSKALKQRIEEQMDHLLKVLIGEEVECDEWKKETLLGIYKRLGL